MRFHPVGGEDVSVISEDFTGDHEALEAVAHALDQRRSLVLRHARYDREADENGVIINLANLGSGRVSRTDSAATGQDLWQLAQPRGKAATAPDGLLRCRRRQWPRYT